MEDLKKCVESYTAAQELLGGAGDQYAAEIKRAKVAIKQAGKKDFYKILGVSRAADLDAIKKAYKKGALKWHPDRHASKGEEAKELASNKFKAMSEAYEVLSDPEKKKLYDSGVEPEHLDDPNAAHMAGHGGFDGGGMGGGMGGIDPNIIFEMFMGQGGGGGGRRPGGF